MADIERALEDAIADLDAAVLAQQADASGTTAVLALDCGGQFLVASIGDSLAMMCGVDDRGHGDVSMEKAVTQMLSDAHRPDQPDELRRIISAGGFVKLGSDCRPRLQGELAVSRAIGDRAYRSVGLIAKPAITWHRPTAGDRFLILASDGLLEHMTPPDVCQLALSVAAGSHSAAAESAPLVAIALGSGQQMSSTAQPVTISPPCSDQLAYCVDCCEHGSTGGHQSASSDEALVAMQRPHTLQQTVGEVLQETAWNRTALDNIAVLVVARDMSERMEQPPCNTPADATCQQSAAAAEAGPSAAGKYTLAYGLAAIPQQLLRAVLHGTLRLLHGGHILRSGKGNSSNPRPMPDKQAALEGEASIGSVGAVQRWLSESHHSPSGFCTASYGTEVGSLQAAGETALVSILAGVPMESGWSHHTTPWHAPPTASLQLPHKRRLSAGRGNARPGPWLQGSPYDLEDNFDSGHFGEVWRGTRTAARGKIERAEHSRKRYVLKRLLSEHGSKVRRSGLREAYFGRLLRLQHENFTSEIASESSGSSSSGGGKCRGSSCRQFEEKGFDHIVRFVESFEAPKGDLWLVFEDEGKSLNSLIYEYVAASGSGYGSDGKRGGSESGADGDSGHMVQPSSWWHQYFGAPQGEDNMRDIMRQLLLALSALQSVNVTHRDVKPGNLLLSFAPPVSAATLDASVNSSTAQRQHSTEHSDFGPSSSRIRQTCKSTTCSSDSSEATNSSGRHSSDCSGNQSRSHDDNRAELSECNDEHSRVRAEHEILSAQHDQPSAESDASATGHAATQEQQLHSRPWLRLIDFGSAVDAESTATLYGEMGPSADEETTDYSPPEATFAPYWHSSRAAKRTWPYDMWSTGVVWLELLLGTPHVFQVGARTRALLEHRLHLSRLKPRDAAAALLLRGFMELCIYPPEDGSRRHDAAVGDVKGGGKGGAWSPVPWSCTDEAVSQLLEQRSLAKRPAPSLLAVRLLRALLHWNPAARPTADEALRHAFFTVDLAEHTQHAQHACGASSDGSSGSLRFSEGWC